jgi:hypothetical protein
MQAQLRLRDIIYRSMFSADEKVRKLFQEIRQALVAIGVRLPPNKIHAEAELSQYHTMRSIYAIFKQSNTNADEAFFLFKNGLKKEFPDVDANAEQHLVTLVRLFSELQSRSTEIMNCNIVDEETATKVVPEYGPGIPLLQ